MTDNPYDRQSPYEQGQDSTPRDVFGGQPERESRDVYGDRTFEAQPDVRDTDTMATKPGMRSRDMADEMQAPLLEAPRTEEFRSRWEQIQTQFVDEPRDAVRDADRLVDDIMTALADGFTENKRNLEAAWNQGQEADTEALRLTLQKYRALFGRLLTT